MLLWWRLFSQLGTKLLGKVLPKLSKDIPPIDTNKINEQQAEINKAEIVNAPQSSLRLWRSFIGWVLGLLLCWELVGRMLIIPICFPDWGKTLPPSNLEQVTTLLMGMLGLGF